MECLYLGLADFLLIAEAVLGISADVLTQSARVVALAEPALAAPGASFGGEEFYPEFARKAAVLCVHLVRNHPLPDGNKRTAYLCMIEFIERNGRAWHQPIDHAEEDDVVETMVNLAAGIMVESEFVGWIRTRIR